LLLLLLLQSLSLNISLSGSQSASTHVAPLPPLPARLEDRARGWRQPAGEAPAHIQLKLPSCPLETDAQSITLNIDVMQDLGLVPAVMLTMRWLDGDQQVRDEVFIME
jgi:hypothetical protein